MNPPEGIARKNCMPKLASDSAEVKLVAVLTVIVVPLIDKTTACPAVPDPGIETTRMALALINAIPAFPETFAVFRIRVGDPNVLVV